MNQLRFATTSRPRTSLPQILFMLLLGMGIMVGGVLLETRPAYALSPDDIAITGVRADDADGVLKYA